jgi:hypothetical protein
MTTIQIEKANVTGWNLINPFHPVFRIEKNGATRYFKVDTLDALIIISFVCHPTVAIFECKAVEVGQVPTYRVMIK